MARKKRPEVVEGKTRRVKTGCGSFFMTMNWVDNDMYEVEMRLGKAGNCIRGLLQLVSTYISDNLQSTDTEKETEKKIKEHLIGFTCGNPFFHNGEKYSSCIDWVGKTLLEEMRNETLQKRTQSSV